MNQIVIDPGHGGRDPGASVPGLNEKDLNLGICRELARLLRDEKISALPTREDDSFISLEQRCEVANNSKAALFLSVHCNASEDQGAAGIEAFHAPDSEAGAKFARALRQELVKLGRIDRGVKPASYYVLKHTEMPACLVECGFITNPAEAVWLKTHIAEIARALAQGIIKLAA
jgi:N-acetylmuramoyl-L-alanine amidase